MEKLKDKIAVVTGGNSGIGYATAKELKQQGAKVIITGRRKQALDEAAQLLSVTGIIADQGKVADIENLVKEVKDKFSKVDILFINAGVLAGADIESATEAIFDSVINVNFKGVFFTLSRFIPILNDGASVIFLSSNTASMHAANSSIYSSGKAAINVVMKTAAVELAPRKIRVNAVSPGPIKTEILKKLGLDDEQLGDLEASIIQRIPLHEMGNAADVGKLVAYLSGEASAFITGAEILMDGGMSL